MNFLPAVIIGGPPHAGKSILLYSLTAMLDQKKVRHHAIRACPDGEGNWTQESHEDTVSRIRVKMTGEWPESFVQRICQDLQHRCLPFLVDMGGRPQGNQVQILKQCTHVILLLREDKPESTRLWQQLINENGLTPIAIIYSQLNGESKLLTRDPFIGGTLSGLERYKGACARGPVFDAVVEQLITLFEPYTSEDLDQQFLEQAPGETINLYSFQNGAERWEPYMLPNLLESLPQEQTTISLYGRAPGWVYAAIAAATGNNTLYQFDPRRKFGWLQPSLVQISAGTHPDLHTECYVGNNTTVLSISFPSKHIEYIQPEPLPFPKILPQHGLVLSGPVPFWLFTALARLYRDSGVPWIAIFYPTLDKAIVAYSQVTEYRPGDVVNMPVVGK